MKVLVTGGAGVLGSGVAAALRDRHEVTVLDLLPMETDLPQIQLDLADGEAALAAIRGFDLLCHCAAVHPWKQYTDDQYLDLNIKGTYWALKAAAENGIPRVAYTSSIAAMGYEPQTLDQLPITEDMPCRPTDSIYSITKHVGEQFCAMFHRSHGTSIAMLRPPHFSPGGEGLAHALRLLWGHMEVPDLVQAHVLAVERAPAGLHAFLTVCDTPFQREDAEALREDPVSVIGKYYPQVPDMIAREGLDVPPIGYYYSIAKARRVLGYEPKYTFASWLRGEWEA